MTYQAKAEWSPNMFGVRLAVADEHTCLTWQPPRAVLHAENGVASPESAWLHLREDVARAIYEALADYFGHSSTDARTLRRDYDAERKRVDKFIEHLTGGSK